MGPQLDSVLFADEGRQQVGESFLSLLRKLGGTFVEGHDERRQVAVGGEHVDVVLLLPNRGGSGSLIGGVFDVRLWPSLGQNTGRAIGKRRVALKTRGRLGVRRRCFRRPSPRDR